MTNPEPDPGSDHGATEPQPSPGRRGLWLRELLLVVVVVSILAAIAIPSLLRSHIAANEVTCQEALKRLVSTESVWRQTASTRNGIQDYWTRDVAGFYARTDVAGGTYKYVDIEIARADATGAPSYPVIGSVAPRAGYFFSAMTTDENGNSYLVDTDSTGLLCANPSKFAFCGYPQTYGRTGVRIYTVNEAGVVYQHDTGTSTAIVTWPAVDPTVQGWCEPD